MFLSFLFLTNVIGSTTAGLQLFASAKDFAQSKISDNDTERLLILVILSTEEIFRLFEGEKSEKKKEEERKNLDVSVGNSLAVKIGHSFQDLSNNVGGISFSVASLLDDFVEQFSTSDTESH